MLSNIWVYKKTSKVMISLLLAAVLVLATQNWLLGLFNVYRDRGGCRLGETLRPYAGAASHAVS
jgi:hypothetical protein